MPDQVPVIRVLKFRTEYVRKPGHAELVPRDWVSYAPVTNLNTVTEDLVHTLIPPDNGLPRDDEGTKMGYMQAVWRQIEPAYKAWKEGTAVPLNGIPLAAWAGLNAAQVEILRQHGIKTVEEVAMMTDTLIQKIMLPNLRQIKVEANEFLSSRGAANTAAEITLLKEQNKALQEQMAEALKMLAERAEADEDKPKRGRPRKIVDEQEAA